MKVHTSLITILFLNIFAKLGRCSAVDVEESIATLDNDNKVIENAHASLVVENFEAYKSKNKRDVTVSIITAYSTDANGDVITIFGATTLTVAGSTTPSTTATTTAAAVETTTTSSSLLTASTTTSLPLTETTSTAATSTGLTTAISSSTTRTGVTTATDSTTTTAAQQAATTEQVVNAETTSGDFLGVAASKTTSTTSGKSVSVTTSYTNPNPSTSITPLPSGAVTTLTIQSYETLTFAYTTYTTKRAKTSMWVTLTVQGYSEVIQTTFAQRFKTMYSSSFSGSSGSIGLGTYSGTIGVVKSSLVITNSENNAAGLSYTGYMTGLFAWALLFLV